MTQELDIAETPEEAEARAWAAMAEANMAWARVAEAMTRSAEAKEKAAKAPYLLSWAARATAETWVERAAAETWEVATARMAMAAAPLPYDAERTSKKPSYPASKGHPGKPAPQGGKK